MIEIDQRFFTGLIAGFFVGKSIISGTSSLNQSLATGILRFGSLSYCNRQCGTNLVSGVVDEMILKNFGLGVKPS
jgi:hypothetical protein